LLEAVIHARLNRGEAGPSLAEAAALILDPQVDRDAVRESLSGDRKAARRISAAAFPAVAHAALAPAGASELRKRVQLTWAVLRGRI
jgi:phytoene synthase